MRQWFTMKKADDGGAEIIIYDEIGKSFWGEASITAKQFLDDLAALGDIDAITLRINSPGGDVFDGVAIHNALKNHGAKITAHIDGIAASIASYIAMAADKIVMPSNAFMLIHGASGFAFGNAEDMRAVAADLERVDKSITATYVARSGSKPAAIKALMKEDRLIDAAEAKELGLADEVSKEVKMAANFSLRLLPAKAAETFRAKTEAAQSEPPPATAVTEGPAPESPLAPDSTPPVVEEPIPLPAPVPAQVIDLGAAKQQGIDEHKAYVSQITDLCILASAPEKVGGYVRAGAPIDQVRKELLELRASADVVPHHPMLPKTSPAATWTKITDKINARAKK